MGCLPTKNKIGQKNTMLSGAHSEKETIDKGASNTFYYKAENQIYTVTLVKESKWS